ncbi:hypothetical protein WME91_46780 [Sorangium sp. So ce269]
MPSITHEALVDLFKNRPTLAAEMLHGALGQPMPSFTEARVESSDLTEIVPSNHPGSTRSAAPCTATWCYLH